MKETKKKKIPALEGLFTMPPEKPALLMSKCPSCGNVWFPRVQACRNPYCSKKQPLQDIKGGQKGKLETFTVNYYPPPPPYHAPTPFVPYANGQIELPEGVIVSAMMPIGYTEKDLKVGMDVELVIDHLYDDDQGNEVVAWKYKPASKK